MKFLAFAAVASAFVIPDASVITQLVLDDNNKAAAAPVSPFHDAVDSIKAGVDKSIDAVNGWLRDGLSRAAPERLFDTDSELDAASGSPDDDSIPVLDPLGRGGKASNLTIYQLISACNYTTQFAALVDQFPAVVELLNGTAANYTLFVPADAAFAKLPGGALNETRGAVLESIVRYHVGLGAYPYKVMFAAHTIPSAYREALLGGEPQRLRVRFEKALGVRVNFYSRVVAPNFAAANGVVHAVDSVVLPPTFVGRELSLVPAHFSTLLLAMAKSNFTQLVHGLVLNGSTVFAPSNTAFAQLGPEINAFLFNTPQGLKYLHALLRYSTVPNATVYSDAYYGPALGETTSESEPASPAGGLVQRVHYQLPTLLGNATVSVNVTSVPGYSVMLVNDKVRVAVQDGVAKNGVVQEVGRVVFPPVPAHNHTEGEPGSPWQDKLVLTVADLVARMGPYVDGADGSDVPAPVEQISEL